MRFRTIFILGLMSTLLSFIQDKKKNIKVYLIGDSTMSIKEVKAYPETGWGMPFAHFFNSTVTVDNRAKNGRSTKTFISENLWSPVEKNLRQGDYVFIQFGHNDESKEKADRYTTPEEYKANLLKFIDETRKKKAIPVLLTPVSRRRFDAKGNALETHEIYSNVVRDLVKETRVAFIDMDKTSRDLLQKFGKENSALLFLQLKPGEHPNYPLGKEDNTHFNELGARLMAQIVLQQVKQLNLELSHRIAQPLEKNK